MPHIQPSDTFAPTIFNFRDEDEDEDEVKDEVDEDDILPMKVGGDENENEIEGDMREDETEEEKKAREDQAYLDRLNESLFSFSDDEDDEVAQKSEHKRAKKKRRLLPAILSRGDDENIIDNNGDIDNNRDIVELDRSVSINIGTYIIFAIMGVVYLVIFSALIISIKVDDKNDIVNFSITLATMACCSGSYTYYICRNKGDNPNVYLVV